MLLSRTILKCLDQDVLDARRSTGPLPQGFKLRDALCIHNCSLEFKKPSTPCMVVPEQTSRFYYTLLAVRSTLF